MSEDSAWLDMVQRFCSETRQNSDIYIHCSLSSNLGSKGMGVSVFIERERGCLCFLFGKKSFIPTSNFFYSFLIRISDFGLIFEYCEFIIELNKRIIKTC